MEETTAYITADILKDVVTGSSGTAYMCKISWNGCISKKLVQQIVKR